MKKRFPWWLLLVAFVAVPLVEIYVIVQVGQVIGAWWTIALLIADSILGSWLIKREGARAWRALRSALDEGRMPARELADGMLILVGGTLMLTPGFVSDIFGILCILPFTRPFGRRVLAGIVSRRLAGVGLSQGFGQGTATGPAAGFPVGFPSGFRTDAPRTQRRPGDEPESGVVRGEVVDDGREPPRGQS